VCGNRCGSQHALVDGHLPDGPLEVLVEIAGNQVVAGIAAYDDGVVLVK
jgi:hypothetical protein